jgi:hypothetical protein
MVIYLGFFFIIKRMPLSRRFLSPDNSEETSLA